MKSSDVIILARAGDHIWFFDWRSCGCVTLIWVAGGVGVCERERGRKWERRIVRSIRNNHFLPPDFASSPSDWSECDVAMSDMLA